MRLVLALPCLFCAAVALGGETCTPDAGSTLIHLAPDGNNTSGDGSVDHPYASAGRACANATDNKLYLSLFPGNYGVSATTLGPGCENIDMVRWFGDTNSPPHFTVFVAPALNITICSMVIDVFASQSHTVHLEQVTVTGSSSLNVNNLLVEDSSFTGDFEVHATGIIGIVKTGLGYGDISLESEDLMVESSNFLGTNTSFHPSSLLSAKNCSFLLGGVVYVDAIRSPDSEYSFDKCEFMDNHGDQEGSGALYIAGDTITVTNSKFINNLPAAGLNNVRDIAIAASQGNSVSLTIMNNEFVWNKTLTAPAAPIGCFWCDLSSPEFTIQDNVAESQVTCPTGMASPAQLFPCSQCPSNSYCGEDEFTCTSCPLNSISNPGSAECIACGFFQKPSDQGKCKPAVLRLLICAFGAVVGALILFFVLRKCWRCRSTRNTATGYRSIQDE
jgi:hypothetical protein